MSESIVFGARGFLGASIARALRREGGEIVTFSRRSQAYSKELLENSVRSVVFAQGENFSSGISGSAQLTRLSFESNVLFILERISELVESESLASDASIVVLSSVWQVRSRPNKVPYVISKSSISGLVPSLSAELGSSRRINAVLPGVIESPMSRKNLPEATIRRIESETPGGRLISVEELTKVVLFLLGSGSSGINGQSFVVDGGWSANVWID